jgi:hypothetical protein
MRHLLFLLFLISPCILFAGPKDSAKQSDTLTIADSLIHNINISCPSEKQPRCINSQEEFGAILNNDCTSTGDIDFKNETLLVVPIQTYGCKLPDFLQTIKFIGNKVLCNIHIIRHGNCAMNICRTIGIVIPKINGNSNVEFTQDLSEGGDKQ